MQHSRLGSARQLQVRFADFPYIQEVTAQVSTARQNVTILCALGSQSSIGDVKSRFPDGQVDNDMAFGCEVCGFESPQRWSTSPLGNPLLAAAFVLQHGAHCYLNNKGSII